MANSIEPTSRRIPLFTGLTYHVLEWDADSDHTIVLVHGFLDLARGWSATVRRSKLAGAAHIIAPDMRGHGDSDRVGAGGYYHFMDYIADLVAVIETLGRPRVSLVGHSMGGAIASYVAASFPEKVHRLALLEGVGPAETSIAAPERLRGWVESWQKKAESRNRAGVSNRGNKTYGSVAEAADRLRAIDGKLDPDFARELAEHGTIDNGAGLVFKHDPLHLTRGPYAFQLSIAEELWNRISCPVLLVEGGDSPFLKLHGDRERRYRAFTDPRIERLEGAGHMMQRHRPQQLGDLLAEFLLT